MKQLTSKLLLIAAMVCFCQGVAFADVAVKLGKANQTTIPANAEETFTYAPSTDCKLLMYFSGPVQFPSVPQIFDSNQDIKSVAGYYKLNLHAGVNYTITTNALGGEGTVWFEIFDPANPGYTVSIDPEAGSTLSQTATNGQILLRTNFLGTYGAVTMQSGYLYSGVYTSNSDIKPGNVIGVDIVKAMDDLYDQGMAAGANIKVTITGVADEDGLLYNGTGNLDINYVAAPRAGKIVATNVQPNQKLYNYYVPGGKGGVFTFTASTPVNTTKTDTWTEESTDENTPGATHTISGPYLEISASLGIESCFYYFPTTVSADGLTITADIRGKQMGDFNGLAFEMLDDVPVCHVSMKLRNLYDRDGQLFQGLGQGNVGSACFDVDYEIYEQVEFASQWQPVANGAIKDASTVSVTFDHGDRVFAFEGLKFAWEGGEATVPAAQCTVTTNGNTKTVTATIPAAAKQQPNVKVSLYGITSADNLDYEGAIAATFNAAEAEGMLAFSPDGVDTIDTLSEIIILTDATATGSVDVKINGTAYAATLEACEGGYKMALNPGFSVYDTAGCTKVADGTQVTIELGAGMFSNGLSTSTPASVAYTIAAPVLDVAYDLTLTPADGSKVYAVDRIVLSYDSKAVTGNGLPLSNAYLTTPTGAKVFPSLRFEGDNAVLIFPQQTKEGEYTLNVAEGFFRMGAAEDYMISSAIQVTFNVVPLTLVTDPEVWSLIEDGNDIDWEILFVHSVNLVEPNDDADNQPYIEGKPEYTVEAYVQGKGTKRRNAFWWYRNGDEDDFELPNGRYTFVFPAGSIYINGELNPVDVRLTYIFGEDIQFAVSVNGFEDGGSYTTTGTGAYTFEVTAPEKAPEYLAYDLFADYGTSTAMWVYGSRIEYNAATSTWSAFKTENTKLRQGTKYTYIISGYDSEEAFNNRRGSAGKYINPDKCDYYNAISFDGATPPFVYSEATLLDINPADGSTIEPDDFDYRLVLTFSEAVTIDKAKSLIALPLGSDGEMNDPVPFKSITGSGTTWTLELDPAADYMTLYTEIFPSIYVYDAQGHQLRGSGDAKNLEELSHYRLSYTLHNGADLVAIECNLADGAEVESLSSFVLSSADFTLNMLDTDAKAYLYVGATVDEAAAKYELSATQTAGTVILALDEPLEISGTYTLYVPERIFEALPKEGLGWKYNHPLVATYTVDGKYVENEFVEADTTNMTAHEIVIYYAEYNVSINPDCTEKAYLLPKSIPAASKAWHAPAQAVELTATEKGDGTVRFAVPASLGYAPAYTLVVPAGLLKLTHTESGSEKLNAAISKDFDEHVLTGIESLEAEDGAYRVYDLRGNLLMDAANRAELRSLPAGLYIINGTKYIIR